MVDHEARERISRVEGVIEEFRTQFEDIKAIQRMTLNAVLGLYATVIVLFVASLITILLKT